MATTPNSTQVTQTPPELDPEPTGSALKDCPGVVIRGCTFSGNAYAMDNCDGATISGSVFSGNGYALKDCDGAAISDSVFSGNVYALKDCNPTEPASASTDGADEPAAPSLRDEAARLEIGPKKLERWRAIRVLYPNCASAAQIALALRTYGRDPAERPPNPENHMDVTAATVEDDIKTMKEKKYWDSKAAP